MSVMVTSFSAPRATAMAAAAVSALTLYKTPFSSSMPTVATTGMNWSSSRWLIRVVLMPVISPTKPRSASV